MYEVMNFQTNASYKWIFFNKLYETLVVITYNATV